ncbi:MAG: VOC family protein, partial [Methylococcales bacterium]
MSYGDSLKAITKLLSRFGLRLCARSVSLVLVLGYAACAGPQVERIPPVSRIPTHRHDIGRFVWHDLLTSDIEAAQKFYGSLFNWRFEASEDSDYLVILNHSRPIGGIIHLKSSESKKKRNRWLASLSVKNVDQAAEFTRISGGVIYEKPRSIPDRGRMAI